LFVGQGIVREGEVGEAILLRITTPSEGYSRSYDELLNEQFYVYAGYLQINIYCIFAGTRF